MIKQDRGNYFSVTSSGTATATATQSGVSNVIFYITDISGSTSSDSSVVSRGTISVLGGASGNTVLWQDIIPGSGSTFSYIKTFSEPLTGAPGQSVKVVVTGTIVTYANIAGFSINAS